MRPVGWETVLSIVSWSTTMGPITVLPGNQRVPGFHKTALLDATREPRPPKKHTRTHMYTALREIQICVQGAG